MQDLWRLSATDIAALIRSKKISATEAASAALARLDAVNPKINAVVDHRPADVLAQAAAIDAAIARGELMSATPAHRIATMIVGAVLFERHMLGQMITPEMLREIVDTGLKPWVLATAPIGA